MIVLISIFSSFALACTAELLIFNIFASAFKELLLLTETEGGLETLNTMFHYVLISEEGGS